MKELFLLLIAILFFAGFTVAQNKAYFPIKTKESQGFEPFSVKWFSWQLSAMREPIIYKHLTKGDIYRFTWLRTIHHPVAIRIEKRVGSYAIYWKSCDGAGGEIPGRLIIDKQKPIDKRIWDQFLNKVAKTGFWKMASRDDVVGKNGSDWILEGKRGRDYHAVDRWMPYPSDNFYKCCDFLIAQTDLKIATNEKY